MPNILNLKKIFFSLSEDFAAASALWLAENGQIRKNRGTVFPGAVPAGPTIMIGLCSPNLRSRG
jgi:hypothetical protein